MTAALIAAVVALFGLLAAHRLTASRERNAEFRSASATFRDAFADALLNLEPRGAPTSTVLLNTHHLHVAAINAFRPHIGWWKKHAFDRAATSYRQLAESYNSLGPLEAFASEQTPDAQAARARLLGSIQQLLAHSKAA